MPPSFSAASTTVLPEESLVSPHGTVSVRPDASSVAPAFESSSHPPKVKAFAPPPASSGVSAWRATPTSSGDREELHPPAAAKIARTTSARNKGATRIVWDIGESSGQAALAARVAQQKNRAPQPRRGTR